MKCESFPSFKNTRCSADCSCVKHSFIGLGSRGETLNLLSKWADGRKIEKLSQSGHSQWMEIVNKGTFKKSLGLQPYCDPTCNWTWLWLGCQFSPKINTSGDLNSIRQPKCCLS